MRTTAAVAARAVRAGLSVLVGPLVGVAVLAGPAEPAGQGAGTMPSVDGDPVPAANVDALRPSPGAPPVPVPVCSVDDDRLTELSGLAVDGDRWWAIADGGRSSRAFALDPSGCGVTATRSDPTDPDDVEDVALGPDGALWLSDTGDNDLDRTTVATIVLPRSGPTRVLRLTYPDGPHDAEALVVGDDGVPLVITKTVASAGVYRPATAPGPEPTPMARVGEIVLPLSDTVGGPLGSLGSRTITGATVSAPSPSGRVVAVRTYTDAWLFRLPSDRPADADVLAGALRGAPVRIPLPDEAQGEAIAFTPDGALLSGSEARDGRPAAVRRVDGAVRSAFAPDARAVPQPDRPPADTVGSSPPWLPAVLGAVAVAVVLAALALVMTLHARRRRG